MTQPVQVLPVVAVNSTLQIRTGIDTITVENHLDAIWAVLRYTNGMRERDDILDAAVKDSPFERDLLTAVLGDLEALGVVTDSRSLYATYLPASENPLPFVSDMRFTEYLEYECTPGWQPSGERIALGPPPPTDADRHSCRGFGDTTLDVTDLAALMHAATNRPPSGGGLYPIRVALVLNRPAGSLSAGVYHYDPSHHALVPGEPASEQEVRHALNREDGIHNAPAVIVISGDMDRQTRKYANRGWRYTLIEGGIATERVVATATRAGIASLVFGGYDDRSLSRLMYGPDSDRVRTIITVAIGTPASTVLPDLDLEQLHARLDAQFVGEGRFIQGTGVTDLWRRPGDLSFHQVLATIRPADETNAGVAEDRTCGGTSASTTAARARAIVECVERASAGTIRVDATGPARTVNPTFDPTRFSPLTPDQVEAHPALTQYSPDQPLEWVTACHMATGEETLIPVDFVFYPISPQRLGRKLLAAANSSGIASHTDPEEATRRAFLELLERHSVLTSWHAQTPPPRAGDPFMGDYATRRRTYWRSQGYDLIVLDYSTGGAPIAGVAIGSDTATPCFAFGSAAAIDWNAAVTKALHEAESGIAAARGLREDPVAVEDITTPLHHGRFHAYDQQRIAWSFLNGAVTPEGYVAPEPLTHFDSLIATFQPLRVAIDSPDPIRTVRVLSPGAFPISFGVALEHRPTWSVAPDVPHFIA